MKAKTFPLFILITLLHCTLFSSRAEGQTSKTVLSVSGTVVDAETNEPLSYASVGIFNKPNGTITNTSGVFDLSIPVSFKNDTLAVSMMGYRSVKFPIVGDRINMVVKMQPAPLVLKEV